MALPTEAAGQAIVTVRDNVSGWFVATAGATSWAWVPPISDINQYLTAALTLTGIVLAGLKIIDWVKRKRNDREDNP